MQIVIKHKYLVFPVNTLSPYKTMTFSVDGKSEYSLEIRMDPLSPNFHAYIDVSRYRGKTLSVFIDPETELSFEEADTMNIPSLYRESYRPQVHFTAKNGWINDPNGLVYIDGQYHMFYQHNPCENQWRNMHWGHAVSTDMIHWEEKDIALFPDKTGTMFSGSAIVDERNILGLQTGDTPTVLLYYTATEPFSQYIAYSVDSLQTIRKYSDSPILPHLVGTNRDPKVFYCEEWNAYAMVLYLEEDRYGIFRSNDLLHWEQLSQLSLPGDDECPDLFPLVADDGTGKWVFIGAHDRYMVGDMGVDGFHPIQEARSLHYGKSAYAGQTFSGVPNGRVIRIDWDRWDVSTPNICGQMSFPAELTLKQKNGLYHLCARPIQEIERLYEKSSLLGTVPLRADIPQRIPLAPTPYLIKMNMEPVASTRLALKIFGITLLLDRADNSIKISDSTAPLTHTSEKWEMLLLVDRCSVECYLDDGTIYCSAADEKTCSDYALPYLEMTATTDCTIQSMELHSLRSIWTNEKEIDPVR